MKRLLEYLIIKGEVLTMDALLTQKDIARKIVEKEALCHVC
jgi:predicted transposase YbfD/YdcC